MTESGASRACFPGSFNPLTIAHLAIAEAALEQCGIDSLVLVISEVALGKDDGTQPDARKRADAARRFCFTRPWLKVEVSPSQLLVDVAKGYEWLILGADKWNQVQELRWYDNDEHVRDNALKQLPRLAIVPRAPTVLQNAPVSALTLVLPDPALSAVSSTGVRQGNHAWRAETNEPRPQ
jgi:nicotinic acid mononucleotide adenylyltransferase